MNKLFLRVLLLVIILSSIVTSGFSVKDQGTNNKKETIRLMGTALNVACNKTAIATVIIYFDGTNVTAEGFFDGINLFGIYKNVKGFVIPGNENSGTMSLLFDGIVSLGDNDNSGFPPKTKTQYVMSLILGHGGAIGTYKVGKLLPHFDYEQYGIMHLSIQRRAVDISNED